MLSCTPEWTTVDDRLRCDELQAVAVIVASLDCARVAANWRSISATTEVITALDVLSDARPPPRVKVTHGASATRLRVAARRWAHPGQHAVYGELPGSHRPIHEGKLHSKLPVLKHRGVLLADVSM